MCYDRLKRGERPACIEACPAETLFGDRQELIQIAWNKIDAEPGKYIRHVYGEHEAGGTAVLYISDVPLDFLGFQGAPGDKALPELTGAWLQNVKPISLTTAGLMGGLFWIIGRRMQAEEQRLQRESE
jgi:formate dehydrogenase iron-sulfur subunit